MVAPKASSRLFTRWFLCVGMMLPEPLRLPRLHYAFAMRPFVSANLDRSMERTFVPAPKASTFIRRLAVLRAITSIRPW